MKIAILYSGHIRTFNKVKEKHLQFIDSLRLFSEVKIFVHTYSEIDSNTHSWWNRNTQINNYKANTNEVIDFLQPQTYVINGFDVSEIVPEYFVSDGSFEGTISMVKSINEVYKQLNTYSKNSNWLPDYIIKTRFDISFNINKVIDAIKHIENKKGIFIKAKNSNTLGGVSDIFFIHKLNLPLDRILEKFNGKELILYFKKYKIFYMELFIYENFIKRQEIIYIRPNLEIHRLNGNILKVDNTNYNLMRYIQDWILQRNNLLIR